MVLQFARRSDCPRSAGGVNFVKSEYVRARSYACSISESTNLGGFFYFNATVVMAAEHDGAGEGKGPWACHCHTSLHTILPV
ncbi:hypothetical protein PoB_005569300 [Plakobranchus ocellatus]|uniref:Uncharacterized protein n=1 Tax=Plakobranchus ocellatus TaxID=259542 RepID=A0AAV4CE06_9GAST|nr:hypothetical protein PoB_005569300 [Plakobranchus ocellatus]